MRKSAKEAQQTRARIVAAGVQRSSSDGLSGLTIGSLAGTLEMSKAGVVGPFGSRQHLQLAVLAEAGQMFTDTVIRPALDVEAGLPRLYAVIDAWCSYLQESPFPNGCFVTAASCELDGQPGELRDAVRDLVSEWRGFLREQIAMAQTEGDLDPCRDPSDLLSVLNGLAMSANQEIQMLGDRSAGPRARRLMHEYLDALRAPSTRASGPCSDGARPRGWSR